MKTTDSQPMRWLYFWEGAMPDKPWDGLERRTDQAIEMQNIHRRMDKQDNMLQEIRDMIVTHLAAEKEVKPAIDELITIWRGSKVAIAFISGLAGLLAALAAALAWAKDHIKL